MALNCPNVGAQEILSRALNKTATGDLKLKLYSNDITPGETDTVSTYTETDFTGYAAIDLPGTGATITNADPSEASWAAKVFTSSAGSQNKNCYGYYVTNSAGTVLMWSERFTSAPFNIVNNGDTITVTPKFTLD